MQNGTLRSSGDGAVYWFPDHAEIDFWLLTKKNIESRGGLILDERYKFGFIAKARPDSYCCKTCRLLLTKL